MSITRGGAVIAPTVATHPSALDRSPTLTTLSINDRWRCLIEEVIVLKEALDHVSRWPAESREQPWIGSALAKVGLQESDFDSRTNEPGLGMPHSFLQLVLGRWFSHRETSSETFRGLAVMPEWAVVGWVRLDQYRLTSALPQEAIVAKAREVLRTANAGEKVRTYGFEGFPLLWAGEGKNRTQLFRLAGVGRLSELVLYPRPDLSGFVARPLLGMQGMTVLNHSGMSEVLPFGDLSRRLLVAMGVRWSDVPSLQGWGNLRSCSGMRLGLGKLVRLACDEKRIRLAAIGRLSLAKLDDSGR